jgi:hypothetical protein
MGDVMAQVMDELHKGFLNNVREGTVVLSGQILQMLAQPLFSFLR